MRATRLAACRETGTGSVSGDGSGGTAQVARCRSPFFERLLAGALFAACVAGCGRDLMGVADRNVETLVQAHHEMREAIPFLETGGRFFDFDQTTTVDRTIVLPMLKSIREIAVTEQLVLLRPEERDWAFGLLVKLPHDAATVDRMARAVEDADAQFPGLILQQWGREWLMMNLIDQPTYEFLKQNDPDIDKQR